MVAYKYIYSIIIPHKNIPKLLQRCLDSIPQRDDTEIIIVDDNSDPNIVDFNNFPGKDRKNTTVILDKKGGGAGHARNLGLEVASGKKLLFADADDYFNYCIRDVLEEYKNDEHDLVFFRMSVVDCETYKNIKSPRIHHINEMFDIYEKEPQKGLHLLRFFVGSPCAKIIHRSVIDSFLLRFDETPMCNDERFIYMVGFHSSSFLVNKLAIYCVTERKGSIVHSELTEEKELARMKVYSARDRFYAENKIIQCDKYGTIVWVLAEIKKQKKESLYQKCIKILKDDGLNVQEIEARIVQLIQKQKKDERKKILKRKAKGFIKKFI